MGKHCCLQRVPVRLPTHFGARTQREQRAEEYAGGLERLLLALLVNRTRAPIVWRDTTAVHKEQFSRAGVGAEVLRKYAHFDDAGVQKLNALAAATIARFASRVASDWRTCTTLRPSGPTARRTTLQRVTRDTTGLMCCKLCCNFTTSVGVFWGQVGMCSQYNL